MSSFIYKGIEYKVADVGADRPGIESEYTNENSGLDLTYRVDWTDRRQARLNLLGGTTFFPFSAIYGYLSRELPHQYSLEEEWLWCKKVHVQPEISRDSLDGAPGALYAILKARYESPPYELLEDAEVIGDDAIPDESLLRRFVSRKPSRSKNRVLSAKAGTWRFIDRVESLPFPVGIPINDTERIYCWHQVPVANIPWSGITLCYSKSNLFAFDGIEPGKAIFTDWSYELCPRLQDGQLAANVFYTVVEKPNGANSVPDPKRGFRFFEVVAFDGSGNKPHPSANFARLFLPSPAP